MSDLDVIIQELDAIGANEIWDTRPAPRGHGGQYVEIANQRGALIAIVYRLDDAEFIAHSPEHVGNLLGLLVTSQEASARLTSALAAVTAERDELKRLVSE